MGRRLLPALALAGLALALAGCGGEGGGTTQTTETTTTETTTTTTSGETTKLRVYFLLEGKVQPVGREVQKTEAVAQAALDELAKGPTQAERELGLTNAAATWEYGELTVTGGVAEISAADPLPRQGLAQVVYTLTQFPTVKAVEIAGKRYTRANMEDYTPIILVESPLPFETVGNPLRATGTANTFEATFQYEVVEPEGRVVDSTFVTATSGSGQRGTFDFTTRKYEISRPGLGALVVFELSAKDGSRIHVTEIPVRMTG